MITAPLSSTLILPSSAPPHRRTAVFRGDLRSITGYGYETRALADLFPAHWDILGVDLHYNPKDSKGAFPGELISDDDVMRLCSRLDRRIYIINNTLPNDYVYFPGAVNISTLSWETDALPPDLNWPEMIGAMDYVWAKSSFHLTLLERCGAAEGAAAITWPFDFDLEAAPTSDALADLSLRYFETFVDDRKKPSTIPYVLERLGSPVLLSVSSLAPRKGLPILLSEWRDYVAAGGAGVLLLKLRPIHNWRVKDEAETLMAELLSDAGFRACDRVQIAYTFEDLDREHLRALYKLCDAYVSSTYGEGFGGPIAEALALGKPVIAPRHSSLSDLLPPGYPLEVECSRHRVALAGNPPIYPHGSSWSLPVRGGLTRAFAAFALMSDARRAEVMRQAREHAKAFCSKPVVAAALRLFFEKVESGSSAWN